MKSSLKETLSDRWAKKGVNPYTAQSLITTLLVIGILPPLASMIGGRPEWLPLGIGALIATGVVWVYFARVLITFNVALKVLEKHHLGTCVKWNELKMAAARQAVIAARNVRDNENLHGRNDPITIEVREEFGKLWSVIGPDGFELVGDKTEIFKKAHAGV